MNFNYIGDFSQLWYSLVCKRNYCLFLRKITIWFGETETREIKWFGVNKAPHGYCYKTTTNKISVLVSKLQFQKYYLKK